MNNIALNKIYGGTGFYAGFPYSNAFDGDIRNDNSTNWFATPGAKTARIYVEFENSCNINLVKLSQTGTGIGLLYRCKDFTVQGSNNKVDWINIVSYTLLDNLGLQDFIVDTKEKYKYWGIFIQNHYSLDYSQYPIGLNEIEMYSTTVKHLVKSSNKMQSLLEDKWVDTGITGTPTALDFEEHGMDDVLGIGEYKWGELTKPIEVFTWADNEEALGVDVEYTQKEFVNPELELTVPEYSLLGDLERPISVITCTDGDKIPVLKSEYDLKGVGTRIMKRG